MSRSRFIAGIAFALCVSLAPGSDEQPLAPVQARKKVGDKITVEMTVRAAKDRLEIRGEIYLDSEPDFRDEKNFAVVIMKKGAASLKAAGIDSPADYFLAKKIRATGIVKEVDNVPRVEIEESKQITVVPTKDNASPRRKP